VDQTVFLVHTDMDFHPEKQLVLLLGLVHLEISLALVLSPPAHLGYHLVEVELVVAIKVASRIVPCFMDMTLALR
jgi:hypothetical protein